jgi:hypothetical protein
VDAALAADPGTSNEVITTNLQAPRGAQNIKRRVLPTQKRARKNTENTNNANRTPSFEFTLGDCGKGTWLEEVAWLIADFWHCPSTCRLVSKMNNNGLVAPVHLWFMIESGYARFLS